MAKKEHKRLSIAELRNFKGFEGYTEEQAAETIDALEKLSILFYRLHMKNKEVGKTFKATHQQEQKQKRAFTKNKKKNESGKNGEQPHAA